MRRTACSSLPPFAFAFSSLRAELPHAPWWKYAARLTTCCSSAISTRLPSSFFLHIIQQGCLIKSRQPLVTLQRDNSTRTPLIRPANRPPPLKQHFDTIQSAETSSKGQGLTSLTKTQSLFHAIEQLNSLEFPSQNNF